MSESSSIPDVSVLVPVYNEAAHVRETVAAMLAQELDGLSFELVLADGRSEDETKAILLEIAQRDARVRVFDNPARTVTTGLNVCLRHARGRYVARMDAHTYYPACYLRLGVERLRRGDGVAWVAGPQLPRGTGTWSRRVALALGTRLGMGGSRKWKPEHRGATGEFELDTGVFAGVWERSTLERLGGWDDDWVVNEDSELAARVHASGGRIVCLPEMAAQYVPRDDLRRLWRQYWRYGFYRAKTSSRHPGSLRRSLLLPPALVLTGLAALAAPRALRRPARAGLLLYGGAVALTSARAARRAGIRVALGLPAVFATMHAAWGLGFLAGCVRFGAAGATLRGLVRSRAGY